MSSVKNLEEHPGYKTVRQWALEECLPRDGAEGVYLWANRHCQRGKHLYFAPSDVRPATAAELEAYFALERERRRSKDQKRRSKLRKLREEQRATEADLKEERLIFPYVEEIARLKALLRNEVVKCDDATGAKKGVALVIDTETTGVSSVYHELLQLSIIDVEGAVLFESYFRPLAKRWDAAEHINGITPETVQDAPCIGDKIEEINTILSRAGKIIGYNVLFDLDFLRCAGASLPRGVVAVDVMEMYTLIHDAYNVDKGVYMLQKLTAAASHYGYNWEGVGAAHNSLADARATLYVHNRIMEDDPSLEGKSTFMLV